MGGEAGEGDERGPLSPFPTSAMGHSFCLGFSLTQPQQVLKLASESQAAAQASLALALLFDLAQVVLGNL